MNIFPDCIPCTYKVCLSTLNVLNIPDDLKKQVLTELGSYVSTLSTETTPCVYHSKALKFLSNYLKIDDPYKNAKYESNVLALSKVNHLEKLIKLADDPLYMAFKISAAGNIIDMGITPNFDLDHAIDEIPNNTFELDSYKEFRELLALSKNILILGDNSGEIVFDLLLIKELKKFGCEIVYAVKGGPVLNDATIEDANQADMQNVCKVIQNGSDMLGTEFDLCSDELKFEFEKADMIISKGQANLESLEGNKLAGDKLFFVLRMKCEILANYMKANFGSHIFMRNKIHK